MRDWVYDIETYPRCFTIAFEHCEAPIRLAYEISDYRNDSAELLEFFGYLHSRFARLVGFNNWGFDYPVIHLFLKMQGKADAPTLYQKAMAIIESQDKQDRWSHQVKPSDMFIPQIDLFKIHHFDNNARATSLKALEFNMRSHTIEDLPFPVGTILTPEQIVVLKRYNAHDVSETKKFYHHSKDMIAFREELTEKYHRDFLNHNDTKIGKDFFVMELEKAGVQVYDYGAKGRTPKQTPRPVIHLRDAILPWIQFRHPELQRVLDWFKQQSITETKGVFKDITATVNQRVYESMTNVGRIEGVEGQIRTLKPELHSKVQGFEFVFGTGGIHGSLSSQIVESDDEYMILDLDVTSYYPNLAIKNGLYPEHLGTKFVSIYSDLFEQRTKYPKKSAESAMLKLALNGVYGDSNSPFSVFYDPLFTMRITLNGQLLLCLLAENLMLNPDLQLLQINTDGLTVRLPRDHKVALDMVCDWWMQQTRLNLESVEYSKICIRDVNNYLAVSTTGAVKRKGDYDHAKGWHQDASALVVPKVVEKVLVEGANIRQTIENWPDPMDFMSRIKVRRPATLTWDGQTVQNTTRYCVTKDGKPLVKILPALGGFDKKGNPRDQLRPQNVKSGWNVTVYNKVTPESLAAMKIDYDYYIQEVEKLVMGLK